MLVHVFKVLKLKKIDIPLYLVTGSVFSKDRYTYIVYRLSVLPKWGTHMPNKSLCVAKMGVPLYRYSFSLKQSLL